MTNNDDDTQDIYWGCERKMDVGADARNDLCCHQSEVSCKEEPSEKMGSGHMAQ